jgi:hypothetical protein
MMRSGDLEPQRFVDWMAQAFRYMFFMQRNFIFNVHVKREVTNNLFSRKPQ